MKQVRNRKQDLQEVYRDPDLPCEIVLKSVADDTRQTHAHTCEDHLEKLSSLYLSRIYFLVTVLKMVNSNRQSSSEVLYTD